MTYHQLTNLYYSIDLQVLIIIDLKDLIIDLRDFIIGFGLGRLFFPLLEEVIKHYLEEVNSSNLFNLLNFFGLFL